MLPRKQQGADLIELMEDCYELLPLRLPEELRHTALTDKRRKYLAEIISSDNDWDPANPVSFTPGLPDGNLVGRVADIHQRPYHHLVVDLHSTSHASFH